jgi:DMSO/TMAO reductase YedYZ molybdopterin-dependent catalytic subunit
MRHSEPWSATHPLPNAGATVQPAPGRRPELTSPPSIPEASWRLKIHGLIARPLVWTLADLRARPAMHQFITLSCISNTLGGDLIGTTR